MALGPKGGIAGDHRQQGHHVTDPEEKYRVLRWREIAIDAGFDSAVARAAGVEIGVPVVYRPRPVELAGGLGRTSVDDRAGCAVMLEVARAAAGGGAGADGTPRVLGAGGVQPARRAAGGPGVAPAVASNSTWRSPPTRPIWPRAARWDGGRAGDQPAVVSRARDPKRTDPASGLARTVRGGGRRGRHRGCNARPPWVR